MSFIDNTGLSTLLGKIKTLFDSIVVPTKVSELTNDSGYLSSVPSEYVTDSELTAKNYATQSYVDTSISGVKQIPSCSTSDNDKVLTVVGGVPTWATVVYQTFYTGSAEPTSTLGSDGDLYLKI